jgi:hypothetical protein
MTQKLASLRTLWLVCERSILFLKEEEEEEDRDLRSCRKLWRWCRSGLLGSGVFVDF